MSFMAILWWCYSLLQTIYPRCIIGGSFTHFPRLGAVLPVPLFTTCTPPPSPSPFLPWTPTISLPAPFFQCLRARDPFV